MTFSERVIGAAKLDPRVYREVEADPSATGQAIAVVALVTLAEVVGAAPHGPAFLIVVLSGALIGWLLWGSLIYLVGVYLLPEPQTHATVGELLRPIGFAAAPGLLRVFAYLPLFGRIVRFAVWVWLIMTTVMAVREALDYRSTGRAIAVCLIASVVGFVIRMILAVTVVGMTFLTARGFIF
jgi:hypothetical protein